MEALASASCRATRVSHGRTKGLYGAGLKTVMLKQWCWAQVKCHACAGATSVHKDQRIMQIHLPPFICGPWAPETLCCAWLRLAC